MEEVNKKRKIKIKLKKIYNKYSLKIIITIK